MKNIKLASLFCFIMLSSCSIGPEAINYNHDECAYCKMKISDVRFGAEIVTKKGKIFKYDSAECLIRTYIEDDNKDFAFLLVTDFSRPETLIDARQASFVISENQPSPMGGNLSAYEVNEKAKRVVTEKGGILLDFDTLTKKYTEIYK